MLHTTTTSIMASRSDQGVIPYKFDFVPKDMKVMKHTASTVNNNVTSKCPWRFQLFQFVDPNPNTSTCLAGLGRLSQSWGGPIAQHSMLTSKTNWRTHQSGV